MKRLEEKYLVKLSYWVVYNGRQLAIDEIMGKWDSSFDYAFKFKAEVERKCPGSIVHIDYEKFGKRLRFTKMFVAFKPCIDGFLHGCRPYLGIDNCFDWEMEGSTSLSYRDRWPQLDVSSSIWSF